MASLESRLAALEQRSSIGADRIRLVQLRDDESQEQALERIGATDLPERVIFVRFANPDPVRVAKLEAGITPAEMTTAELLLARTAIQGQQVLEASHGAQS